MALKTKTGLSSEKAKEFAKVFEQLIYRHSAWKVWQDFVDLCAISISNAVDKREAVWETREKAYMSIKGSYTDDEFSVFVSLFSITIHALEDNPAQDFLGELYMKLNFGNGWKGQFFTPFHISEMMARMTIGENTQDEIKKKGYISVNDPTCGSGCMLIALAQAYKSEIKEAYHNSVLFVGQDIDPVVAKMCYIQLSLLGCAGYVAVGDSLTNPIEGNGMPAGSDDTDVWFTPLYFSEVWTTRRLIQNCLA